MPQISNFVKKNKLLALIKSKIGFPRMVVVLVVFFILLFGISGYFVMNSKEQVDRSIKTTLEPAPSVLPSASPTPTAVIPTYTAKKFISPTPSKTTIHVRISNNGSTITDNSIELTVRNNNTGQEQKMRNTSSSWTLSDVISGRYKISTTYPIDKFVNTERSCDGCQNKQDISNYGICGYIVDIRVGDDVNLFCSLLVTKPLVTQSPTSRPDYSPPTTNIYYPQPGGSITYKIEGKVCAIATAPSDDSNPSEIETEYKFDEGNWSGYATGRGYLCADTLPNGPHILSYHSKDKAGNIESIRSLNFSVSIPGN